MYNTIAKDHRQGADVIAAIKAVDPQLTLLALAGAPIVKQAREEGLHVVCEAFADRAYNPDGSLVNRRRAGAVLHDPTLIAQRMLRWVREGLIEAIDGSLVPVEASSICVHGDNPAAVETARVLKDIFVSNSVQLRSFTQCKEVANNG
ncbi:LamB/YcsF family protein [compost metagenome]